MNGKLKRISALLFAATLRGSLLFFMQVFARTEQAPPDIRLFSSNIAPSLVHWADDNSLIITEQTKLLRYDLESRKSVTLCSFDSLITDFSIRNPDEFYVATEDPSSFTVYECTKAGDQNIVLSLPRTDSSGIVLGKKHACLYSISEIGNPNEIATTIRMIGLEEEPIDQSFLTTLTLIPILCGFPIITSTPFPLVPSLYTWSSPDVNPKMISITDAESINAIVTRDSIIGIQQQNTVTLINTDSNSVNVVFTLGNENNLWTIINDNTLAVLSQDGRSMAVKNDEKEKNYILPMRGIPFSSFEANLKGTDFSLVDTSGTLWILQIE